MADAGERLPDYIGSIETLVPWAVTDNGDVCFWDGDPARDPNRWTVVVNEGRGPQWERYAGDASSFLADVLARRHTVEVFPPDFPSPRPTFEPA
jgi:hypothetical protein